MKKATLNAITILSTVAAIPATVDWSYFGHQFVKGCGFTGYQGIWAIWSTWLIGNVALHFYGRLRTNPSEITDLMQELDAEARIEDERRIAAALRTRLTIQRANAALRELEAHFGSNPVTQTALVVYDPALSAEIESLAQAIIANATTSTTERSERTSHWPEDPNADQEDGLGHLVHPDTVEALAELCYAATVELHAATRAQRVLTNIGMDPEISIEIPQLAHADIVGRFADIRVPRHNKDEITIHPIFSVGIDTPLDATFTPEAAEATAAEQSATAAA